MFRSCQKRETDLAGASSARYPPMIISYVVRLSFRFPLSPRMVEEMLAARSIETVDCTTSMPSLSSSLWILGAPHSGRASLSRSVADHRADGTFIASTRRSPFDANAQQSRA